MQSCLSPGLVQMEGVAKLDKIRNERISGTTKVGKITKKVQERRWYGRLMRRETCTPFKKEGDGNESTREKEERKT